MTHPDNVLRSYLDFFMFLIPSIPSLYNNLLLSMPPNYERIIDRIMIHIWGNTIMNIVAMVGSNRNGAYNLQLAKMMQDRYAGKLDIEILAIDQLPMYDEGDELQAPKIVSEIGDKINQSDGILFVTPEHNASIPALLKNAIDWFSRIDKVMPGKPAMVVGASKDAMGTVKAQLQLQQILNSPDISVLVLPGHEVYVGRVHEKMKNGQVTDQPTLDLIDTSVEQFIQWIRKNVFSEALY